MKRNVALLSIFITVLTGSLLLISINAEDNAPNWCYEGQPWGDGRCNNQPTEADNRAMWENGYYGALFDAGGITLAEIYAIQPSFYDNVMMVRFLDVFRSFVLPSNSNASNVGVPQTTEEPTASPPTPTPTPTPTSTPTSTPEPF